MTESATCKICHERPPSKGFLLCDRCKGFDPLSDSERRTDDPSTETALNLCQTCGAPIEPYKIGRTTRAVGECRTCYCRRRYGPDWKPGGKSREERAAKCKERRAARKKEKMNDMIAEHKNDNGNGSGPESLSDTGPPEVHAEHVSMLDSIKAGQAEQAIMAKTVSGALTIKGIKHLTIPFVGEDEAILYERIKTLSLKERRSMEQQVLYFLDRVIEV